MGFLRSPMGEEWTDRGVKGRRKCSVRIVRPGLFRLDETRRARRPDDDHLCGTEVSESGPENLWRRFEQFWSRSRLLLASPVGRQRQDNAAWRISGLVS